MGKKRYDPKPLNDEAAASLDEIAAKLGLSTQRVWQILGSALAKLKDCPDAQRLAVEFAEHRQAVTKC